MKKVKHLLIVDDDVVSSYLIESTIEDMGIADKINIAYNGKEALDFLEAKFSTVTAQPEELSSILLLLDLNMPVMNGFEFLDEFTTHYTALQSKVSICILTSSDSPKDIKKAAQYEIAGFITKPLTEQNLLPILAKV